MTKKEKIKQKLIHLEDYRSLSIQGLMLISFTIVSTLIVAVLSIIFYQFFDYQSNKTITKATEQVMYQTTNNLEDYLQQMRQLSDTLYYSCVKEIDLSVDTCEKEMSMLYEANKDKLISFALFSQDGKLLAASPNSAIKSNVNVVEQDWFIKAKSEVENLHFSTPHVENLFVDSSERYNWVISLSRCVSLTNNGETSEGVLLVDMNYSYVEQILDSVNSDNSNFYIYLKVGFISKSIDIIHMN